VSTLGVLLWAIVIFASLCLWVLVSAVSLMVAVFGTVSGKERVCWFTVFAATFGTGIAMLIKLVGGS
jgi:hypothetical protein